MNRSRRIGSSEFRILHLEIQSDGSYFGMPFLITSLALAIIVIYKHRANLQRAMAGTEPKLGESRKAPSSESAE